jgi:hypothetical protein
LKRDIWHNCKYGRNLIYYIWQVIRFNIN